jgi:predicted phage terminase large subunit-like protein
LTYLSLKIEESARRKITRGLVLMPPRHGKSELTSKYTPCWWLGKFPNDQVLLTSYSDRFSKLWGRRARDLFQVYGPSIFGVHASTSHAATEDWGLVGYSGTMATAGIHGSIVGRGADLLLIDDPVKDHQAALSPVVRDDIWEWWASSAASRLSPTGVVWIVMTQWHEDDLAGRLMKDMAEGGERFEVIRMPAIAEEDELWKVGSWEWRRKAGEALWPSRWPLDKLELIKQRNKRWWSALYQQRPIPKGGSLAQREWFPIVGVMPAPPLMKCRFWDCAGGDGKVKKKSSGDPDWTVGALVARENHRYFIEDIIRVQKSPGEINTLIRETAMMDGPEVVIREEMEPGSSGGAIIAMRRALLAGFNYDGRRATGAKQTNWEPMLIQAEGGNFRALRAPWNKAWFEELETGGQLHDDQLDAVAGAFKEISLHEGPSLAAGARYPLYY